MDGTARKGSSVTQHVRCNLKQRGAEEIKTNHEPLYAVHTIPVLIPSKEIETNLSFFALVSLTSLRNNHVVGLSIPPLPI